MLVIVLSLYCMDSAHTQKEVEGGNSGEGFQSSGIAVISVVFLVRHWCWVFGSSKLLCVL